MNILIRNVDEIEIAIIYGREILIHDVQTALDLIAAVMFEKGCQRIIINKAIMSEKFFDLRTGLAGEILQKFINYHMKLAIIGDFSHYTSKSMKDFIFECNSGRDIFFMEEEEAAVRKLITVF